MTNLNLDEILALFENGERRYAEDPIFKSVADSLKMGLGVYAVLDHTLKDLSSLKIVHREAVKLYSATQEDLDSANQTIKELIAEKDGNDIPTEDFGYCKRCGGHDDKTRVGLSECNHCYSKFP